MNNGDILTTSFFTSIENNIQNDNKILIIEINDSNNNLIATNQYTFTQINSLINENYFIIFKIKTVKNNSSGSIKSEAAISNSNNINYNYLYIKSNDNETIIAYNPFSNITLIPDSETDYLIYDTNSSSGGEQK